MRNFGWYLGLQTNMVVCIFVLNHFLKPGTVTLAEFRSTFLFEVVLGAVITHQIHRKALKRSRLPLSDKKSLPD